MHKLLRMSMDKNKLFFYDYQVLSKEFEKYSNPREKIRQLVKNKKLIRIKKGLYIDYNTFKNKVIQKEVLANVIYGPSYISFEYALAYYGMIPEKVYTVTSATIGRSRIFKTPLGNFSYQMVKKNAYYLGIDLFETEDGCFHIATPAKAIADKVVIERKIRFQSIKAMREYLFDNLRIDISSIGQIDISELETISNAYNFNKLKILIKTIRNIANE
jgi:hypothetical protein